MQISLDQIKELRKRTGVGVVEAKEVLKEAKGEIDQAIKILRKRGQKIAAKKATREAREGMVGCYLHGNGKVAALVEVFCETDFVAKNEEFQELAKNIAMQVAAMDPVCLEPDQLPADISDDQLDGRKKEDACLMSQKFFKDENMTIEDLIREKIAKLGENIKIGKFVRFNI